MHRIPCLPGTRGHSGRARHWRPLLEALEDRLAPAVFNPLPNLLDSTTGNTLRAAVIAANGNGQDNTINLGVGVYGLSITNTNGHENAAAQGDLNLTAAGHTLVIQGAGPDATVINANSIDRVFQVLSGVTVVFRDLSIVNGIARDNGTAGAAPYSTDSLGGGILNQGGNVTLDHVLLWDNIAGGGGGATGATGTAGFNAAGGAIWTDGGSLTMSACTVETNLASGGPGGNGTAGAPSNGGPGGTGEGGGLFVNGGTVHIGDSTFRGNTASGGRGGFGGSSSFGGNGGGGGMAAGGGIFNSFATILVSGSTLVDNAARGGNGGDGGAGSNGGGNGGGGNGAQGGGLLSLSFIIGNPPIPSLRLVNCTVAANEASGGNGGAGGSGGMSGGNGGFGSVGLGGGMDASVDLHNSTVAFNRAVGGAAGAAGSPGGLPGLNGTADGGGVYAHQPPVNVISSIIANNITLVAGTGAASDFSGTFTTASHDLLADGTGAMGISNGVNGNLVGADARLRPLDNYGGPTQTFALYGDSPAVNAGSNPDGLTTDQRGFGPRDAGGAVDIGAFQLGATPPVPPSPPPPPPPPPTGPVFHPLTVRLVKVHGRTRLDAADALTGASRGSVFPFGKSRVKVQVLTADVNGDGFADVIALAVVHGVLQMRIFSGLTLAPL
jgi:hypothetical protein